MVTLSFEAIGTWWSIEAEAGDSTADIAGSVAAIIDEYARIYSRFDPHSLVSNMAHAAGTYTLPPHSVPLFALYRDLYDATDGAVTPLIGATVASLGYDAAYSLTPNSTIATTPDWDKTLEVAGTTLRLKHPALIDIGAAGKGQLIDLVSEYLQTVANTFTVDAGGDIRVYGYDQPQRIGLEDPSDAKKIIGYVELTEGSICASATNRRAWGDGLHHIVDPHTNRPVKDIVASWVIADSAMVADGLATAVFFAKPASVCRPYHAHYAVMNASGELRYCKDFPGVIYAK